MMSQMGAPWSFWMNKTRRIYVVTSIIAMCKSTLWCCDIYLYLWSFDWARSSERLSRVVLHSIACLPKYITSHLKKVRTLLILKQQQNQSFALVTLTYKIPYYVPIITRKTKGDQHSDTRCYIHLHMSDLLSTLAENFPSRERSEI